MLNERVSIMAAGLELRLPIPCLGFSFFFSASILAIISSSEHLKILPGLPPAGVQMRLVRIFPDGSSVLKQDLIHKWCLGPEWQVLDVSLTISSVS